MAKEIIYKNEKAKNKACLIKQIDDLIKIPSDGIVIFFATQDNTNRSDLEDEYNEDYSNEAFYHDKRKEKTLPQCPREIDELIGSGLYYKHKCEHFIWISKRIGDADKIYFAFVYCHELQHLKQALKNEKLLIIGNLLKYSRLYEDYNICCPIEVECEAKAKEILVKHLYDKETFDDFIERMKKRRSYDKKRYDSLQKLTIPTDFHVEREIQQFIRKKKADLKKIQKQRLDRRETKWKIDFDNLCSCEDPHEAIKSAVSELSQDGDLL